MPNRFEGSGGDARESAQAGAPASFAKSGKNGGKAARAGWSAWRCASLASLALAGCVVANVAGCGGGGGGSTVIPAPQLATATILLLNSNAIGVNGTVTLNGVTKTTTNSRASFPNLKPGTYPLVFTVGSVRTSTTIVVVGQTSQTYVAVPGLSDVSSSGIRVSGRTLLNSPSTSTVAACTTNSQPVTAALVIQVRSLNIQGRPVVSSVVRAANRDGSYNILTLRQPGTYRVEARSLDSSAAPFAGTSASFTISEGQTQANLDICTNQSATAPGGTPPPPPGTPTPGPGTGIPSATQTALAAITSTPGIVATLTAAATLTPQATNTPGGQATNTPGGPTSTPGATNTPGGVPTEVPQNTPTNTPSPTPSPTPGAGTPTVTPAPTNTPLGSNPTSVPPSTPSAPGRRR
jgi:hypothetical protein